MSSLFFSLGGKGIPSTYILKQEKKEKKNLSFNDATIKIHVAAESVQLKTQTCELRIYPFRQKVKHNNFL